MGTRIVFKTCMKKLCKQWQPEVCDPRIPASAEFSPLRCSAKALVQLPSVAAYLSVFLPSITVHRSWVGITCLTWPLKDIPPLCIDKLSSLLSVLGHDSCALWSVLRLLVQHLSKSEQKVLPCTENVTEFILRHPSTVMSTIYSGDPVPPAAIHAGVITLPLRCLTECLIYDIGSAMSFSFSILSISLVQARYSWIISSKNNNNNSRTECVKSKSNLSLLLCFWWFAPCYKSSVFPFMKVSLTLRQWYTYLLKCSWLGCLLCKSSPEQCIFSTWNQLQSLYLCHVM